MPRFKKAPTYHTLDLLRWVGWACLFSFIAGYVCSLLVYRANGAVPGVQPIVPGDFPVDSTETYVNVGRMVFFDPEASASGTVSCGTCHLPELNFTDGKPLAEGNFGKKGNRNTPTCRNTGYWLFQFWAGAALGLESQAQGPLENPLEMADADNDGDADQTIRDVARRLKPKYGHFFKDGRFGTAELRASLAAYQRTLQSGESDYDVWVGDGTIDNPQGPVTALKAPARRGAKIFARHCASCHPAPLFTDANLNPDPFHVTGSTSSGDDDQGRQATTQVGTDFKRYKAPSLRDLALTAPYGVAGNFPTLESRLDFYNAGIGVAVNADGVELRDAAMPPAGFLTSEGKQDLLAFLAALNTNGELNQ